MNRSKKIREIKDALKQGVPKRRLDPNHQGKYARELLKGEKIRPEKVEELYENLLEYHKKPKKYREALKQFENCFPEISQKTKIREIKKAVKEGLAKRKIDQAGGGDAVRKLLKGTPVGDAKINQMYSNLLSCNEVENGRPDKASKGAAKSKKKSTSGKKNTTRARGGKSHSEDQLKSTVEAQGKRITRLHQKIDTLERVVEKLQKALTKKEEAECKKKPLQILGITITQKADVVRGKKYDRWYGVYREKGKQHWIYIGKDLTKAESKIRAWLKKNGRGVR